MRDGCYILDHGDVQAGGLKCSDSGLSAGTGALYVDFYVLETCCDSGLCSLVCYHLGSERGGLPGTLETEGTGAAPGDGVAAQVGDGYDGVVEGSLDMSLTAFNV